MEKEKSLTMTTELAAARRALHLVHQIDKIRDTLPAPVPMLMGVVQLLAEEVTADLCLLVLRQRETGAAEVKAVCDRQTIWGRLETAVARQMVEQVVAQKEIAVWRGDDIVADPELAAVYFTTLPIVMGQDEHLGGLLLARQAEPFSAAEIDLLTIAEDHIDSAVVQGYAYHDLQQRLKELETIYRIDHIRDRDLPFDDMLHHVLSELEVILRVDLGFIMLFDHTGQTLEMRAATHQDLLDVAGQYEVVYETADTSLHRGELVCRNDLADALSGVMCLPLILNDRFIGVLGVARQQGQDSFRRDDQRLLNAIGSQMDTAIFESLEQRRLKQVLGRSVDPRIMNRLLDRPDVEFLEGQRLVVTVLYADIRGSTSLTEQTAPEKLVQFINQYLGKMTEVILAYEGTLDKFVGDEVMALFGAPVSQPDHAWRAVQAGVAMQAAHREILRDWTARGGMNAPIGVGIATGELIVGEMGSRLRTDYTAIGPAANLGARICSAAQAEQVLISRETYDLVQDRVEAEPIDGLQFKGVAGPVRVYRVRQIKED